MATNSLIFFSPKYVGVYQLVGRKVLTALTENIGSNTMPISGSKLRDSSHFSLFKYLLLKLKTHAMKSPSPMKKPWAGAPDDLPCWTTSQHQLPSVQMSHLGCPTQLRFQMTPTLAACLITNAWNSKWEPTSWLQLTQRNVTDKT